MDCGKIESLVREAQSGNVQSMQLLIKHYVVRTRSTAYSYLCKSYKGSVDLCDYEQEIAVAVIKALNKYKENGPDSSFSKYVSFYISGALKSLLRKSFPIPWEKNTEAECRIIRFCGGNEFDESDDFTYCSDDDFLRKIDLETVRERIEKVIETFSTEQNQDIIKMRYGFMPYLKPYTYKEIAQKYDMDKDEVRKLIQRIVTSNAKSLYNLNKDMFDSFKDLAS